MLEVILAVFQKSIEMFHQTNKRFFEDIKKYPKVYEMMKNRQDSDSMKIHVLLQNPGVEQGIFRSDVNFAIVNLLVREQFDVLLIRTSVMNTLSLKCTNPSCLLIYAVSPPKKEQGYWKTLYKNIARTASKTRVKVRFY